MEIKLTLIIITISAVFSGLLQVWLNLPVLALVVYIPMFISVLKPVIIFRGKFSWIKSWHIFIFLNQLTSCSFLITIYKLVPIPAVFAVLLVFIAWIVLSLWLTLLISLPIMFFSSVRSQNILDVLSFSVLYIMGEWLCENVFILSFPWSTISMSVVSWSEFIQSASFLGPKFTSLIILVINGLIAYSIIRTKRIKVKISCFVAVGLITTVTVIYGSKHISVLKDVSKEQGKSINILIAQDNLEGDEKSKFNGAECAKSYISMLDENWIDNTDFILLPETAVQDTFDAENDIFSEFVKLAKEKNLTICIGAFNEQDDCSYNAIYAITPNGAVETPYLKQVLVPFGEFMPFASLFGVSTVSSCKDDEYIQPLVTDDYTVGCGICIESIYPSLLRTQAENGAEFFIIPTNDSWFGKSFAREAHYRHSILRSIENERYTLRAGNCGISSVITPWGEELSSIHGNEKGVISGTIKTSQRESIYTRVGDPVLISLCVLYLTSRFFIVNVKRKF